MICLRKKRKKWISWFFGWKLGGFDIFRGQFLKIFKKKPKNLTSPVNIKCFNLKNHHQLKKKILSTKKWRQIYSSSGPTGPPPGTQRVKWDYDLEDYVRFADQWTPSECQDESITIGKQLKNLFILFVTMAHWINPMLHGGGALCAQASSLSHVALRWKLQNCCHFLSLFLSTLDRTW